MGRSYKTPTARTVLSLVSFETAAFIACVRFVLLDRDLDLSGRIAENDELNILEDRGSCRRSRQSRLS
ncbi:MAG: hypothetical protein MZU97_18205 [Bacillus subtilis]|nr:hypothetical protein [Bacillus subtilis]